MANLNVLSQRYATPEVNEIFSERWKTIAERKLWIAVMKAQRELGIDISEEDIKKFEVALEIVNFDRIKEIEIRTRHDVKARVEHFVEVAGAGEHLHKGMTSRDPTDNIEQMQIRRTSELIFGKYVSVLRHLLDKAREYDNIFLTARTHHQAAQMTLLGRRFAMWAEELLYNLSSFERFLERYPLRGIKGPVGTQADMLTLLGSREKVEELERIVAHHLGFSNVLHSTGQTYPRSLDYKLVSHLALLSSACENFGLTMRLMAGYDLVTEGFKEGQVGSSAMPHKMNTRSSERICGLAELLKMYADGASRISGAQWEEGDVSDSVPRRVIIPDAFYTSDGLCETTLTVLNEMGAYPTVINAEVDRYLPFLATTEILMAAVKAGIGRETAHSVIKKHAVAEALAMRNEGRPPSLATRLASDPIFAKTGITESSIHAILTDREHFIGNARNQIEAVRLQAKPLLERYSTQARYEPREIL